MTMVKPFDVPPEILNMIFQFLSTEDLGRVAQVSKSFNQWATVNIPQRVFSTQKFIRDENEVLPKKNSSNAEWWRYYDTRAKVVFMGRFKRVPQVFKHGFLPHPIGTHYAMPFQSYTLGPGHVFWNSDQPIDENTFKDLWKEGKVYSIDWEIDGTGSRLQGLKAYIDETTGRPVYLTNELICRTDFFPWAFTKNFITNKGKNSQNIQKKDEKESKNQGKNIQKQKMAFHPSLCTWMLIFIFIFNMK